MLRRDQEDVHRTASPGGTMPGRRNGIMTSRPKTSAPPQRNRGARRDPCPCVGGTVGLASAVLKTANPSKVGDAKPPVQGRKPKTAGLPESTGRSIRFVRPSDIPPVDRPPAVFDCRHIRECASAGTGSRRWSDQLKGRPAARRGSIATGVLSCWVRTWRGCHWIAGASAGGRRPRPPELVCLEHGPHLRRVEGEIGAARE